jgi:DNA-binding MarR family transcriptional regulator
MVTKDDMKDPEKRENWIKFVQGLGPETDPMAIRLMDELRQVTGLLHRVSENSLASSGLSSAKYRLLMDLLYSERIYDRCELNPSEISKRRGTSRNTISALIRDLEEEGLVERQLDQSDRRRFNIRLTDAGREEVQAYAGIHLRAITGCFDVLGHDDKEELGRLLAKLSRSPRQVGRSGATPNDIGQ